MHSLAKRGYVIGVSYIIALSSHSGVLNLSTPWYHFEKTKKEISILFFCFFDSTAKLVRLTTAGLLQGITELHILVLRLHLLVDLHHQLVPRRRLLVQLTRSLALATSTTSLSHLLYLRHRISSDGLERSGPSQG